MAKKNPGIEIINRFEQWHKLFNVVVIKEDNGHTIDYSRRVYSYLRVSMEETHERGILKRGETKYQISRWEDDSVANHTSQPLKYVTQEALDMAMKQLEKNFR